jgi:hypothetical protein
MSTAFVACKPWLKYPAVGRIKYPETLRVEFCGLPARLGRFVGGRAIGEAPGIISFCPEKIVLVLMPFAFVIASTSTS